MEKTYIEPNFTFVRTDESNKVFFEASGTPGPSPAGSVGGSLGTVSSTTSGW